MHGYSGTAAGEPIRATAWILASLCAFTGTALYILTAPDRSGPLANPIWGSIYGLGYLALIPVYAPPAPGIAGMVYFLFGTFGWPLLATIVIALLASRLLRLFDRRVVIGFFLASYLLVWPMSRTAGTVVYYLPIYGVFLGDL